VPAYVPSIEIVPSTEMPLLAAGTWQYNNTVAATAVEAALKAGFRHIDTAADYKNQRGVSVGLAHAGLPRDSLFITSKVPGCGLQGIRPASCEKDTLAAIREDVAELSSSYPAFKQLDLVLLHFPPCVSAVPGLPSPVDSACSKDRTGCSAANCEALRAQWKAVEAAAAAGLIRSAGVSNYCSACLSALLRDATLKPAVNQVQMHVGMGRDPQGFVTTAKRDGLLLQAWSPLGHGGHGSSEILKGNLTTSIAAAHNKSAAQVALKWIVSKGIAVVTKSSNPAHLAENLDLFGWSLTDSETAALDAASFAAEDTPSFMCDDA